MSRITIHPEGICADRIIVETDGDIITSVTFEGGCDGNGKAVGKLLTGRSVEEAVRLLHGIDCEGKGTSCADQFSRGMARELAKAGVSGKKRD